MSMRPLTRRVIAAPLLVLLTACYNWRATTVSPQTLIPDEQPSVVRVTLTSGEVITFQGPMMRNDSIVGLVGATDASIAAVASRDVRYLEVRRFAPGNTIAVVLGIAAGAAVVAIVLYCTCHRATASGRQTPQGSRPGTVLMWHFMQSPHLNGSCSGRLVVRKVVR